MSAGIIISLIVAFAGWVGVLMLVGFLKQADRELESRNKEIDKHKEQIKKWEHIADTWKELAKQFNTEQVRDKERSDPVIDSVVKQILDEFDKLPLQVSVSLLWGDESSKLQCKKELIRQRVEKLVNWLADKAKAAGEKAS